MSEWYGRDGQPIPELMVWARKLADYDYKRVAEDTLEDGRWVSTVWLGLDHSFGSGPPLIFETMVFNSKGGDENYCERYSTEAEAVAGHQRVVDALKAGRDEAG